MIYRFYDWDDTLVLSRKALYLSYKKALSQWDIQFEYAYFNDFIYNDATKFLKELNFSDDEIIAIKELKEKLYITEYFDEIIFKMPDFNPNEKYYIVTNTNEKLVTTLLKKKYGKIDPFIQIIGSYNGIKRKPEPDLYNYTFDLIKRNWNHEDELHIYEDSIEGLSAALKFLDFNKKRIKHFKLHHIVHVF